MMSLGLISAVSHGPQVQDVSLSTGLYAADAIAAHCVAGSFSNASLTLLLPPPAGTTRKVRQRYTARTTRTTPAIQEPYTPSTAWHEPTQPEHAEKHPLKGLPQERPQLPFEAPAPSALSSGVFSSPAPFLPPPFAPPFAAFSFFGVLAGDLTVSVLVSTVLVFMAKSRWTSSSRSSLLDIAFGSRLGRCVPSRRAQCGTTRVA